MSKDLVLKSGTAAKGPELVSVRTLRDVQFFGLHGSQLSASMAGLHIHWNGDVVVVTHDSFPGQVKWLMPGGIEHLTFKEAE